MCRLEKTSKQPTKIRTLAKYAVCSRLVYALRWPPIFSISCSNCVWVRFDVPLKAMCSKKCDVPLLAAVSYRDPASIQTPTVAVSAPNVVSDPTRKPFSSVETSVVGALKT